MKQNNTTRKNGTGRWKRQRREKQTETKGRAKEKKTRGERGRPSLNTAENFNKKRQGRGNNVEDKNKVETKKKVKKET